MRLVKVGLASLNTTVGAFGANVDRALGFAREMAAQHVTVAVFPEQTVSGYPCEDLVQWHTFIDRQWAELLRFAEGTEGAAHGLGAGRGRLPPGPALQLRRRRRRWPGVGPGAQGEAAHLQHLLRGPHLRPRLPGPRRGAPGRAAGRSALRVRLRRPGRRGVRRPLERRRAHAPPRLQRRRAHLQRVRLALPHRRRLHPPRAGVHPRRRPPVHPGLRQPGRRAGRAHLRRRRLRQPERPPGGRDAALHPGLARRRRRPGAHRPAAHREHHLARRPQELGDPRAAGAHSPGAVPHPARGPALPGARARQLLPARRPPGGVAPRPLGRRPARRARAGHRRLLREDQGLPLHRHRAVRRPRLAADAPHRAPLRAAGRGGHRGLLHAHPLLVGGHAPRRRDHRPRAVGALHRRRHRPGLRARDGRHPRHAAARAGADGGDQAERAGPASARSACGTGPTPPAASSCRPATCRRRPSATPPSAAT